MSDAPRLLHIFPGFGSGGTQLRMVSIINSLGKSFAHHIISLDGNLEAAESLAGDVDVTVAGPPLGSSHTLRTLVFRELVNARGPAAVLTYNWGAIEATLGARIAGRYAVIHNECGFGPDEAATLVRRRVWARRVVLNTIFRTVVTSQTMFSIARNEYKLAARKVQLIRTGVDVARYQPGRNQAGREALGVRDDTVLFGYLGGLRPEKNLGLLVRAFHAGGISNAKLVLAGEGPCRREIEGLVAELGLSGQVVFAGHQLDPVPYLSMLDVFVMSSLTEQVSNAQLEAMASGLPVICTSVGDSRELLGESPDCVVAPQNQSAYARALLLTASDAGLRARLGAANRRLAVTFFPKDRMVREYANLFEVAVANRKRSVRSVPREPTEHSQAT
jgi:L-malate glycosyltransferase